MTHEPCWDDDQLMSELAGALAPPDVPPGVLDAAKAVFTWRTIDAQLAALSYDSAMAQESLAGVRGAATARALTFQAANVCLEVEITDHALIGQILPAEPGVVEIHEVGGRHSTVPVDTAGGFCLEPVPQSEFRVVYTGERGNRLSTGQIHP